MRLSRLPIWIKAAIIAAITVLLVNVLAVTLCTVPFDGMENSIYKGEKILVSRWSYGLRVPFSTERILSRRAKVGDILLFNNPNPSDPYRRVWRRETFIGRCIGTPGDTLMLDNEYLVTNYKKISPDMKMLYSYLPSAEDTLVALIKRLGIKNNHLAGYGDKRFIRSFSVYEYYMLKKYLPKDFVLEPLVKEFNRINSVHSFVIPAKGVKVDVYPWNVALLCNTILHHEKKPAYVRNDSLFVNGRYSKSYIFENDYYWITSNNPLNTSDSRLFGFVPQSHLIGKAEYVVMSPDRGRLFKKVE